MNPAWSMLVELMVTLRLRGRRRPTRRWAARAPLSCLTPSRVRDARLEERGSLERFTAVGW